MSPISTSTVPAARIIGPTWTRDEQGKFIMPEHTLGYQVIAWIENNLLDPKTLGPFLLTNEQRRFVMWWYAVDTTGEFTYRDGILQRLKGWG